MSLCAILVSSDQRRLTKVDFLCGGLDVYWKLEVPSLWDLVRENVSHSVAGTFPGSSQVGLDGPSYAPGGRCSWSVPRVVVDQVLVLRLKVPLGFLDGGYNQKRSLLELLSILPLILREGFLEGAIL